jgi:hypothetical protein
MPTTRPTDAQALRQMTAEDWLYFGLSKFVYLRSGVQDGGCAFVICSATGELLDVFNTRTTAIARIAETDFRVALVH